MGRKVNGEGTIIQLEKDRPRSKCRKWQLRLSTGKDPRTGKYKTMTRRFSGTYTQAKAALREFLSEIEDVSGPFDEGALVSNSFMKMPAPSRKAKEKRALTHERMRASLPISTAGARPARRPRRSGQQQTHLHGHQAPP